MDSIDRELLKILQVDARRSVSSIARELGVPVSTVNDHLRRLQEAGTVRGFAGHLDPQAVGLQVCAFVQVLVDDPALETAFLESVRHLAHVQECHSVSGEFSYLLKVRVADTDELGRFLRDVIRQLPGVGQTNTMITLTTSKETTVLPLPTPPRE